MKYFKFKNGGKGNSIHESSIWNFTNRILSKLIPKANPDFEKKYKSVDTWYIEYDDQRNFTTREIGIDKEVDSDMKYEDYLSYEICTITKNDFILLWNTPIA